MGSGSAYKGSNWRSRRYLKDPAESSVIISPTSNNTPPRSRHGCERTTYIHIHRDVLLRCGKNDANNDTQRSPFHLHNPGPPPSEPFPICTRTCVRTSCRRERETAGRVQRAVGGGNNGRRYSC